MFTVAIIGPDGAGKSTVIHGLLRDHPHSLRRIYMGVNPESLSHMLPTTRLLNYIKQRWRKHGEGSRKEEYQAQKNGLSSSILRSIKLFFFIANRFAEAWYRQMVCWYYLQRGYVVLFDRHFYLDHLAFDFAHPNAERPFVRRVYDRFLEKNYPHPSLTIYLDAPADVLFERKHEGTIERLQQMREAYLKLEKHTPIFKVVDTVQSPEKVLEMVECHIESYSESFGYGSLLLNHRHKKPS